MLLLHYCTAATLMSWCCTDVLLLHYCTAATLTYCCYTDVLLHYCTAATLMYCCYTDPSFKAPQTPNHLPPSPPALTPGVGEPGFPDPPPKP